MTKKTFEDWLIEVNRELNKLCGMGHEDIPDWDYWCAWDDNVNPKQAAKYAFQAAELF